MPNVLDKLLNAWGKLGAGAATAAAGGGGAPAASAGADAKEDGTKAQEGDSTLPDPTLLAGLWSLAGFLVAIVLAIVLNLMHATASEFKPSSDAAANFALFAGFYVAAQVIERVMEFASPLLPPGKPNWWLERRLALGDRDDRAKLLADPAARAAQLKADRAKLVLGLAAILGVLASCLFGLFFLRAIGMHVSHTIDAILTGVTIAAGTKPLHDFISNLQNKNTPTTATKTVE